MLYNHKRIAALIIAIVMMVTALPIGVFAEAPEIGDTHTTNTNTPPADIENAVWVLADSVECHKIEHLHEDKCYYKSCDHNEGHTSACYSEATSYEVCTHGSDNAAHAGTVNLTDVVSIKGTSVSWKTDHPAYPVVKAKYDADVSGKSGIALLRALASFAQLKFCYTVSASATPDQCTHTCSELGGSCYTKLCILEEHTHGEECFTYTWVLKSDINNNNIADDVDTYYTVKYVSDGEIVYENLVLVNMPTPTVPDPTKSPDAQYTYTFAGWDIPVADVVTGAATYTAVYTTAINKYTVTWQDEDGTELELDKNVEYGTMPSYNGQVPTKQGDETKVYTFSGWTPSVDLVSGDVTYTATYSTQNVYKVSFVIDNDIKEEYVIEGETVQAYHPTKEHYKLSPWIDASGAEYDFSAPVTGDTILTAKWRLAEVVFEIIAPNATHTLQQMILPVGSTFSFDVIPDEGYVIESVVRNGNEIAIHHENGKINLGGITDVYEIDRFVVTTSKAALALDSAEMNVFGDLSSEAIFNAVYNSAASNPSTLTASDTTVEYLAYSITILGKTYDWWVVPGTDVSLENFLNQYGLGSLASYIPVEKLPHVFGTQNTERVRVKFAGDKKYPALSATTTVAMIDKRISTSIVLNEGVKVVYGATEADILKLVFNSITADTAKSVVSSNVDDVSIKIDSLNAGNRKVTVIFEGNNTYAPSVAEVNVIIEKAEGIINMAPARGQYGSVITIPGMTQTNASFIEVAMGLRLGDNASADMGTVIYINIPSLIDVDAIENETIKMVVSKIINGLNEKMSGTMTIAELNEALNSLLPYIEGLENEGYTMNLSAEAINALSAVLTKLSEIDGVNEVALKVTVGQQVVLDDAGVYLVAGVIADPNYTTKFAASYAVITPDGMKAELDWNMHDENGLITIEALRNGYDLGASVIKVYDGNVTDANKHLYTIFFGVNKAGELVFTRDQAELDLGAYNEVAFVVDFGNTMYYAEPIARAFVVTIDIADVQFVDGNGNVNNDRIFAYGQDATMSAVAFDRTSGDMLTGPMQYFYAGIQANGEIYRGTDAPTRPGTYTVIALFVSDNESAVGSAIGALMIKPIPVDFSADDNTVVYDGDAHGVIINTTFEQEIIAILDEQGRLNIILPGVNTSEDIQVSTIDEFLAKMENIDIPERLAEYYDELLSAARDTLTELRDTYEITSIALNDEHPVEVGTYKFAVIGITDMEHEIVADTATLTITCAHEYDNACDTTCNLCDEGREVKGHQYVGVSTKTPECGAAGTKTFECTECGDTYTEDVPATGDHTYDNNCDSDCNHCGHVREVGEHIYDNACDDDCNECGEKRIPEEHQYDNDCDRDCNVCDEPRVTAGHVYDNDCDTDCNVCGATREVNDHVYDNDCDPDCNNCGTTRDVAEHVYDNACDNKCNVCDAERDVPDHVYDDEYDVDCNECGATREVPTKPCEHEYDNNCDASCNKCGDVREVNAHAYDDEYDADCNECGAVRDVPERPGENTPPSTGDNAMVSVGILVAAAALSILIFTLVRKKRTEA